MVLSLFTSRLLVQTAQVEFTTLYTGLVPMTVYHELRSLLSIARTINERLFAAAPDADLSASFADGSFPDAFLHVIEGTQELPSVEELAIARPKPHGVFDVLLLHSYCRNRLAEAFSTSDADLRIEMRFESPEDTPSLAMSLTPQ